MISYLLFLIYTFLAYESTMKDVQDIPSMSKMNGVAEISIDGIMDESAWELSDKASITVKSTWLVSISYFQDDEHIYVAFENTRKSKSEELYPEVLIDAVNDKSDSWNENSWWFHTSYSNCEGQGIYNNYASCEIGKKQGWNGNNYPLKEGKSVEIVLEKSLLKVAPGNIIGIAFNVTDTSKDWFFYPEKATLQDPSTWMSIRL